MTVLRLFAGAWGKNQSKHYEVKNSNTRKLQSYIYSWKTHQGRGENAIDKTGRKGKKKEDVTRFPLTWAAQLMTH